MISADFAPNEEIDDGFLALKLLLQPWHWQKGKGATMAKEKIKALLKIDKQTPFYLSFFFTGRSALNFLIKSQHFPKGTETIVQAFTCEAPITPILENKLKPTYVDIETASFSADPIDLSNKINKKTRAIILQHTFGLIPTQRERALLLGKKYNLLLIEDVAHGFSLKTFPKIYKQTIKKYKRVAFLLSFGRSKALSSVFGAAIITPNQEIATKLEAWQSKLNYPSARIILGLIAYKILSPIIKKTHPVYIGKLIHYLAKLFKVYPREITQKEKKARYDRFFNLRFANAQALLFLHQLKKFRRYQKQRRKIVSFYNKNIKPGIKVKNLPNTPIIRYPILVKNRDQIWKKFKKKSIYLGKWYSQPISPAPLKMEKLGYQEGSCPEAEKASRLILNLPTLISKTAASKIVKLLEQYAS